MKNQGTTIDKSVLTFTLLAAAAVAVYGFSKKRAADILNYNIQGFSAGWNGTAPEIQMRINVQNPGNDDFQINGITGNLYSGESLVGSVSSFVPTRIPGPGQNILPVNIRVGILGVAIDVYNLIVSGVGSGRSLKFAGFINVNGLVLPLELNYNLL